MKFPHLGKFDGDFNGGEWSGVPGSEIKHND